ncbi:MAG: hypothetical protein JWP90_99 [Mycetocola sp.]|nr:hypothetical protein [Mycetocola sp.]
MLQRPADAERAPVEDQAASPVVVVAVAEAEGDAGVASGTLSS